MKQFKEWLAESKASEELQNLIKQAGYKKGTTSHYPSTEKQEKKVRKLEELLKKDYERFKPSSATTYVYAYDVNGTVIKFNYRETSTGLSSWQIA